MENFPENLAQKLDGRSKNNSLRGLGEILPLIDFSSNDYLGFAKSESIFNRASEILQAKNLRENGATGSRLLTGNSKLYEETEKKIADFHQAESALIFNSGYDANLGFFASVPQRGDLVFYDEHIHASIRDGIRLGTAKAIKFKHNSLKDLKRKIDSSPLSNEIFIVTESVFSMDGDSPDLKSLVVFCSENNYRLVIDEAHAVGIFGKKGEGLAGELTIQKEIFARIVTFGKALGCHGAAVLGSLDLKNYLINFCRSFIYTTALPPHSVATIQAAYLELGNTDEKDKLWKNIAFFKSEVEKQQLTEKFLPGNSAIRVCQIPGNEKVKTISEKLKAKGFDVKPIMSPTIPKGKERLRFCLHSYNSEEEISEVLNVFSTFVGQ